MILGRKEKKKQSFCSESCKPNLIKKTSYFCYAILSNNSIRNVSYLKVFPHDNKVKYMVYKNIVTVQIAENQGLFLIKRKMEIVQGDIAESKMNLYASCTRLIMAA